MLKHEQNNNMDYTQATRELAMRLGNKDFKADIFALSTALAICYDKDKETTINDLIAVRKELL